MKIIRLFKQLGGGNSNLFKKYIVELNNIISNREKLKEAQKNYYKAEETNILSLFQPFRSRLAFAARRLKIIPSFMSKKWKLTLCNYIMCEAHRDKVEYFLKNYKQQK